MRFPSEKKLKAVRIKLSKLEPSRLLPKDASKSDYVKYKMCEKFVVYLMEHKITQRQLARKLRVDPSRINEIVKYRIDLYTVDKLMDLAEKLGLDFEVTLSEGKNRKSPSGKKDATEQAIKILRQSAGKSKWTGFKRFGEE